MAQLFLFTNMQEKEKKNTKGIENIVHADIADVISISVPAFVISGFTRSCFSRDETVFNFYKASVGAVISSVAVALGTMPEMFAGFLIYENHGALLGVIAGSSMYSGIGALIGGMVYVFSIIGEQDSTVLREIIDGNGAKKTYASAMIGAFIGLIAEQVFSMEESIYKMLSQASINMQPMANYAENYLDLNYAE